MFNLKSILITLIGVFIYQISLFSFANSFQEFDLLIKQGKEQISGTLSIPNQKRTTSLVIMISGSGPQDRNETLDGFKIFKTISDYLSVDGIASFRFDDRGIGKSSGNFQESTLADHVEDIKNIIDFFKENSDYQFSDFVLLGHSQGGITSARVALERNEVRKIVLMAAPSVPLIEIVLYQLRQEYVSTDIDTRLIEAEVSSHNKLMRAIWDRSEISVALNQLKETHKSLLSEFLKSNSSDNTGIDTRAAVKAKEFKAIYSLPSLTSFLYHDTSRDFEQLKIPVLSLFGGRDSQVTITQNKDRMENAFLKGGVKYNFITYSNANHYFQKAITGKRSEYGKLEDKFVDGFLDKISSWIIE